MSQTTREHIRKALVLLEYRDRKERVPHLGLTPLFLVCVLPLTGGLLFIADFATPRIALSSVGPSVAFALSALLAFEALRFFEINSLGHPGDPLLLLMPTIPVEARRFEWSLTRLLVGNALPAAAFWPAAVLMAMMGRVDAAQLLVGFSLVGPAWALTALASRALKAVVLTKSLAVERAAWLALSLCAIGPVAAVVLGVQAEIAATLLGPFGLVFFTMQGAAVLGLPFAAVAFCALEVVALRLAWRLPGSPQDAPKAPRGGETSFSMSSSEDIIRRVLTRDLPAEAEPLAFGQGPQAALRSLVPPPDPPKNRQRSVFREALAITIAFLVVGLALAMVLWARQNTSLFPPNLLIATIYSLFLSVFVIARYPSRPPSSIETLEMQEIVSDAIERESRPAARAPKHIPHPHKVRRWDLFGTLPIPYSAMEEFFLYRLSQVGTAVAVVLVALIGLAAFATGSPWAATQGILSVVAALAMGMAAVAALDVPRHDRLRWSGIAHRGGVVALLVAAPSMPLVALWGIASGVAMRLRPAEVVMLAAAAVGIATSIYLHWTLKRERLTVCRTPYATWAQAFRLWSLALGALIVAFGVTFVRFG